MECKSRWTNIRDQFRRNLGKKPKSGQAAEKVKPYKYAKLLEFLLPHLSERDTISNIPTPEVPRIVSSIIVNENDRPVVSVEAEAADNRQNQEFVAEPQPQIRGAAKKRNKSVCETDATPATVLMEYILRKNDERNVPEHPMLSFLTSMGQILINLPPRAQHTARGRIFNIVHELENEFLNEPIREQQQPISSWVPPHTHHYDGPSTSQGFAPHPIHHDYSDVEHQFYDYEADNPQNNSQ